MVNYLLLLNKKIRINGVKSSTFSHFVRRLMHIIEDKFLGHPIDSDSYWQKGASNPTMSLSPKPQAASHMFWFFLLPCLGFMAWATVKLVSGVSQKPVQTTLMAKVEKIKLAKSPGDRWQNAYALSQELQKMIRAGEISTMNSAEKTSLYTQLASLLQENSSDNRLNKYLLLTLGQMGDIQGLATIEKHLQDTDDEVRFFASWGFVEILSKNKSEITAAREKILDSWLSSQDPAYAKIATSFLVQQKNPAALEKIQKLLNHANYEVRWNAAVALATIGDQTAAPTLKQMFDLNGLRTAGLRAPRDLEQMIATASQAAQKLGNKDVIDEARKLLGQANLQTAEGRAIFVGLAPLKSALQSK